MEIPISDGWIKAVLHLLRTGNIGQQIIITRRARQDWEATTCGAAELYELFDAISHALERPNPTGRLIETMADPGETYEFWIFYHDRRIYAKLCLLPGAVAIKIISAHRPLKGDTL